MNKPNLKLQFNNNTLKLDVRTGAKRDETFGDACKLARILQIRIDFTFNDTPVHAYPNSICQVLIDRWEEDRA